MPIGKFNIAAILLAAVSTLPEKYFVYGKGEQTNRLTTRFSADAKSLPHAREYKTERAAKAEATRRRKLVTA